MADARPNSLSALAGWILLAAATGAVGSVASVRAADFYQELARPAWAPPAWLFGPVWTVLYVLMGVAAWLVWRERDRAPVRGALTVFVAHLALNALWTWVFFAWRQGALAFVEILALLAAVAATALLFARVRRLAGALLLPYLAWVAFATALTWAVWQRNPTLL